MSSFSRAHPSNRYVELVSMYRTMHEEGERFLGQKAEETFSGISLGAHVARIRELIERTGAQNVLDYGAGKGKLYDRQGIPIGGGATVDNIQDYWDVDFIHCYDPAYRPFSQLPSGKFHGVVCTDVLEHCPEEDLDWILAEIFGYAERFVYMSIACYPAMKKLPSGENAHITIRPSTWWTEKIEPIAARSPGVIWAALVEEGTADEQGVVRRLNFMVGSRPA